MKNEELEKEKIRFTNEQNLESAAGCIMAAHTAFENKDIEEAMYWISMASVYCRMVMARK